jgi:hypothetical protein
MAVVGTMTKKTAGWFSDLGLLHGPMTNTTTTGVQTAGLDDQKAWAGNAFIATWKDLVPAMQKKYGAGIIDDPSKMRAILAGSGMTQMAMSQIMEWVTKPGNVLRDAQNVGVLPDLKLLPPALRDIANQLHLDPSRGAMPYGQAYDEVKRNSPRGARLALGDSWNTLQVAIGKAITPATVAMMNGMADGIAKVAQIVNDHPTVTKWLLGAAAGLGAILVVGGTIAVAAAAFATMGWIPLIIGAVGVTLAGIGTAVYANWKHIKSVWDWFGSHDLAGMITTGLLSVSTAIMTWISNLAERVWNFIKHPLGGSDGVSAAPGVAQTIANGYAPAGGFGPPPGPSFSRSGFTDQQATQLNTMIASAVKQGFAGTSVNMDGKAVGKIVGDHLGDDSYNPPSGTSIFDSRQSPSFANFPGQ